MTSASREAVSDTVEWGQCRGQEAEESGSLVPWRRNVQAAIGIVIRTPKAGRRHFRRLCQRRPTVGSCSDSSASPHDGRARRLVCLAAVVARIAGVALGSGRTLEEGSFAALQIQPLTFTGDAPFGAISPDSRFVAYVRATTVRVRQILTDSDVEILLLIDFSGSIA